MSGEVVLVANDKESLLPAVYDERKATLAEVLALVDTEIERAKVFGSTISTEDARARYWKEQSLVELRRKIVKLP